MHPSAPDRQGPLRLASVMLPLRSWSASRDPRPTSRAGRRRACSAPQGGAAIERGLAAPIRVRVSKGGKRALWNRVLAVLGRWRGHLEFLSGFVRRISALPAKENILP